MRLISEEDVIKIINEHTRPDGMLDHDISCILAEVPTAFDKEKVMAEMQSEYVEAINLCIRDKGTGHAFSSDVRKCTWEQAIEIVERGGRSGCWDINL